MLFLLLFGANTHQAFASGPGPVDTILTLFNAAQAASKMPAIIDNAGNNRGAGFNGRHVFVASRQNGNHVYYWDAKDPNAAPKELSISGITGGTFVLSDLAVSGNNVFVSNMVLAGGAFKVYHWSSVESQPRVLLEYPASPDRLGDAITVIGDPDKKALLIASSHGNKRYYVWTIENGSIGNTTPAVQTYDFTSNVNFGRMTRVPGPEQLYLASAPSFGMMLLDSTFKMVDTIGAAFFPSWAMHAQVLEYKGIRLLGYVHVKSSPAANALYLLNISDGKTVREAFSKLRSAAFADRLLHSFNLGNVSNGNASAGLDVASDALGNVQIMGFSAGNGFVVQQLGNQQVTSLPEVVKGGFALYPNPASSQVYIESPGEMQQILLYDFSGRQVATWPVSGKQATLNVEPFQRGTYVVLIRSELGLSSNTLILQK